MLSNQRIPAAAAPTFLKEVDLAARWRVSRKKLQADRLNGIGPAYFKLGACVRYRLDDIEAFERSGRVARGTGESREDADGPFGGGSGEAVPVKEACDD